MYFVEKHILCDDNRTQIFYIRLVDFPFNLSR